MITVKYRVDEDVALITLNRPDRRNAINAELAQELATALRKAAEDDVVRAIVVTGEGKGFCAGADFAEFEHLRDPSRVRIYIVENYYPLIQLFVETKKPIIGAINGFAAGAGASVALACDLRVMADDAALLQAFSNIGLIPDAGSTWLFARQIGYSRAFELSVSGEPIDAKRCLELGLTNRIAPAAELVDHAMTWAKQLAARPTLAVGLTKEALHRAMEIPLRDAVLYEANLQQRAIDSEDHREGVAAFLEKRTPTFKGQ